MLVARQVLFTYDVQLILLLLGTGQCMHNVYKVTAMCSLQRAQHVSKHVLEYAA